MTAESQPSPPPEGALLRVVRKARRASLDEVATAAGFSKAWLSSIETGHDARGPVRGSDEDVAAAAAYLKISPERLETEGERPDAAKVLREILRGQPASLAAPAVDDLWPTLTERQKERARAYIEGLIQGAADQERHDEPGSA